MRPLYFPEQLLTVLLTLTLVTPAFSGDSRVSLSSKNINQGGIIRIKIVKKDDKVPDVEWMNMKVPLRYRPEKKIYDGFIAADLEQKPGEYTLNIIFKPSGRALLIPLNVVETDYGVRKLTLPDKQVNLNKEDLERAAIEKEIMDRLWENSEQSPFWKNSFLLPVDGKIAGPFGRRSIINDQPRSPHTGVDLSGKRGTPVIATNNGRVVLTGNHFFTGNTVVMDHGAGILSMYFHLDEINVNKGDNILRGAVLGTVGSTGRATGPHLHWGIRINGSRIDPLSLVQLSNEPEE